MLILILIIIQSLEIQQPAQSLHSSNIDAVIPLLSTLSVRDQEPDVVYF